MNFCKGSMINIPQITPFQEIQVLRRKFYMVHIKDFGLGFLDTTAAYSIEVCTWGPLVTHVPSILCTNFLDIFDTMRSLVQPLWTVCKIASHTLVFLTFWNCKSTSSQNKHLLKASSHKHSTAISAKSSMHVLAWQQSGSCFWNRFKLWLSRVLNCDSADQRLLSFPLQWPMRPSS